MKYILIIEDEVRMRNLLRDYLTKEGYEVTMASDGAEGLRLAFLKDYDLILLDMMMPFMDGMTMLKELRKEKDTAVIVLTARSQDADKLEGYVAGADDYVTKPFSPKVLMAKIHAFFSRQDGVRNGRVEAGCLRIDTRSQRVFVSDEEAILTKKEYELLVFLAANSNIAFSRETLLDRVWGIDYEGDLRAVDTGIRRLREKLGKAAGYIMTVRGTGYRFLVNDDV
ncbi:response regulator transcription factor [Youngiibacter fragilis]|uniref:Stage 0 sporulation protein A homolog n=1 Tax=Youngiibacter fragilis 232.1 TaxID=994573 RepID=V7I2B7_9CLOT|nr:response regulator transcription factor [Youngiibacter fragilis]ETA80385.1 PhoB family transcriptional regulator [Youngiibacter fragilis 232.1]